MQAFNNKLEALWKYPDTTTPLPSTQTEFCPTQLALSSGDKPSSSPNEQFLLVLDDPQNPKSGCTTVGGGIITREARVTVLGRDGKRKGWLALDFASRSNGQIRITASDEEFFVLYADNGTSYRVARLAFSALQDNTPSSSLQISDPISGVLSSPNTNLALAYAPLNTGTSSLLVGIGGSSGKVLPVKLNSTTSRVEFDAELREAGDTTDFIGATQAILWNRDSNQKPLTLLARERPDILLRRVSGGVAQRQTRVLPTQDGIFTNDGYFWGLQNSTIYRLDVFNFPNLQLTQAAQAVSDANITAISWLVGN